MAVPEKPLVSPHPSARVLSRISSFHQPRTRLQLPPIPPRSPSAIDRRSRRKHILEERRQVKAAAKKTKSFTEFTLRAMRQAQKGAEGEHGGTPTSTDAATNETSNGDNDSAAGHLADILPRKVGPRDKYSGLLASPRPAFSLSPTSRMGGQASKIPVPVSPVMYREIVKRPVMVPTKLHDGRRAGHRERELDWGVSTPMKRQYGGVDIVKKEEECS